jgi:teichuronic acid biosynthesis glycosyltransferase TuaH
MSKGRDYIVHSIQPWDTYVATVLKYITMELCKKNRVLFLDTPLQRSFQLLRRNSPETQKYKKVFSGQDSDMIQINENLWVLYPKTVLESINWISNPAIFDSLNKVNDKRFARQVKYAVDKLGFRDYVVLNDTSMINGFNFKELLKPSVQMYFLRDHITKVAYHARHGIRLEPLLIKKSDLVVTNSPYFSDYAAKYNPNSHFIGQGCDIDLYSDDDGSLKIPDELCRIPHPRIGYTGFLTSIRLDIDLLVHVAEQRPEWSLVLVGPEDQAFKDSKLHKLSNVYFLGGKPGNELPGYVKGFDVAINPQIINEITNINYPLKLDEYLAMGVPVVATKTWFMNFYFSNDSYLAANKEEYITEITKALAEDTPAKHQERIKVGRSHSWANFVEKIYKQVDLLDKKQ